MSEEAVMIKEINKEAVIEALSSLEGQGIQWNEILYVMSFLAYKRGDHQLDVLMATLAEHLWELENTKD